MYFYRYTNLYSSLLRRRALMSERGDILIEVMVAVAVIGLVGIILLNGFSTSLNAVGIMDKKSTAENLARAQMEYVQQQPYDSDNITPVYSVLSYVPNGYSIITPMATRLDPKGDGTGNDDGLQKITVAIQCKGETIFTLEDYKVLR